MFHIDSIHLKNALCFEDARFEIKPGVSIIYGLNRINARKGTNPNGAGKSSFFSQLREVLREDPIVGHKQDAVKTGMRMVEAHIGEKQISIVRNNNKLDVTVRHKGKVFKTKGKTPAKQWLDKNIPISEEEFDTYVHLDSRVSHPLVMGTSADRRRFFESFFGLDKLDVERKLFLAEYEKLKTVKATYTELRTEYLEVKASCERLDVEAKRREYKALKAKLEELNRKNERLQKVIQLVTFENQVLPYLTKLRSICSEDKITEDWFLDRLKTAKWDLKHNTEGLNDALAWEQYKRDNEAYLEAFNALSKGARSLIGKLGVAKATEKSKAKAKRRRELADEIERLGSLLERLKKVKKPEPPKGKKPKSDVGELTTEFKVLKHKLAHAERFNKGVCGECGQEVAVVSPKKIRAKLDVIQETLHLIEEFETYESDLEAYKEAVATYKKTKLDREGLKDEFEGLAKYAKCYSELRELPRQPAQFEGKKYEVDVKRRMVEEDKERLQLLEFLHPSIDLIVELENLEPAHKALAAKASKLQVKINETQEQVSNLYAELNAHKIVVEQKDRLVSRLRKLKEQLVNEEPLKLLIEAYSDKAIKKMAIQAISERLMKVINQYAKVVFAEDYTFEFNWESSQLAFIVHRKHGKSSDVRRLSGAESKLFTLVLVLALMTFVPSHKRCNLLILDEPNANMGIETSQAFKELLPVINKVIPSIIVITPKSEDVYEGAKAYTVVKTKGVAKIVEGHPYEQK